MEGVSEEQSPVPDHFQEEVWVLVLDTTSESGSNGIRESRSASAMRFLAGMFLCLALLPGQALGMGRALHGLWQFSDHTLSNGQLYLIILKIQPGKTGGSNGQVIFPSHRVTIGRIETHNLAFNIFEEGGGSILSGTISGDRLHITRFKRKAVDLYAVPSKGYAQFGPPPTLADPEVPYNGLAKLPPMGWNSWNKLKAGVNAASVRAIADTMASDGMRDAGYQYINIDDTWQGRRDASGVLHPNSKFPDMKALAAYVHSKGLKLGIYSSPGPLTCAGYPGSYRHEQQDANTFAGWGIDYLKYDWCSARYVYPPGSMRDVYARMGLALDRTHRPIVYSLSQYGEEDVTQWAASVDANLWRTTGDIKDAWPVMLKIGLAQIPLVHAARPGHWNDPDMLEVGNGGMTRSEYQVHFSLWCLLRAPLLAGNDPRSMNAATRSILLNREVIAVDQDPLAAPLTVLQQNPDQLIVKRRLTHHQVVVAAFNISNRIEPIHLALREFGSTQFRVRDLWLHAWLPSGTAAINRQLDPHSVLMLRLDPIPDAAARVSQSSQLHAGTAHRTARKDSFLLNPSNSRGGS